MSKYQIKSELSEKQIEADISNFFGWISKDTPFRLLDIDEQLTGADKKYYDSGFAFFMQFKVSHGLESADKVAVSTRSNRSPLQDIREFRKKHSLDDSPSLYFGLRKMAATATEYQHNILLKYANKPNSQAFYVAPLHLNKDSYFNSLFDSVARFQVSPHYYSEYKVFRDNWVSYVGHIPTLKEHISIIPHEVVGTHKHYYSFSQTGTDIGWHSPEIISERPARLSDILQETIHSCIETNRFLNLQELAESLIDNTSDEIEIDRDYNQQPISKIQSMGKKLYKNNGIRLVLLLTNSEVMHNKSFKL